jgi:HK97 gp10 family phage protein
MLKSRLPAIAAELHGLIEAALVPGAQIVAEQAKQRVPVESGDLRDAIHVDTQPEGVYVIAGNRNVFYGHMVEHGTSHSPPEPFLVPALEANQKTVVELAKQALKRGVA